MPDVGEFLDQVASYALTWLPLVFFGLIIYLLWRTLQYMPRVKPAKLEASASSSVSWGDVAGVEEAKAELQEVVDFLRHPKRFQRLGARVPKGILLYGPPGTGKTLLAKAVAKESGAKFYSQSASAFVEMFAGLGAARIRKLFEEARKNAPAIVFIDELDAVGTARAGGGFNREHDQTLNQLLVELDGFDESAQVIVMGASNRLQDLDPALLRPGRFDRQVLVSPPDLDRPRGDPAGAHARQAARRRRRPLSRSRARPPVSRAPTSRTSATRPRSSPAARSATTILTEDFDGAMERVDRRHAAAARRHREGEADPRLPRGRARADRLHDGRSAPDPEGDDRRARRRPRLRLLPADGGALPAHEGGVPRRDEDRARRARRRAGRLRPRHERRLERPREGDRDRSLDGLRVRHVRSLPVADDAGRQLRPLRGDEAAARLRAGPAHRLRLRGGAAAAREAPRLARPARRPAARARDALPRRAEGAARRRSSPSPGPPRPSARSGRSEN